MSLCVEQKVLLSLLRSSLFGEKIQFPSSKAVNWEVVYKESVSQAVGLLAFDAISPYEQELPPNVYESWMQSAYTSMVNNVQVTASQAELVTLLEDLCVPYVILKGLSAAAHYPRPDLRLLGDVDFLIDTADIERVSQALERAGYSKSGEDHICHITFKKPPAYLELHFSIAGIPEGEKGALVESEMATVFDRHQKICVDSDAFFAPCLLQHALIVLLHMQGHMLSEGLGLRHLCDWACFVANTKDDEFWEKLLILLEKIGLLKYTAIITRTASIYLGAPCPDWAIHADDSLCEAVILDIFESGNFGKKDPARAKSGLLISQEGKTGAKDGKFKNLYRALHRASSKRYPIVRRIPLLHPFFDVLHASRYCLLSILGKKPALDAMFENATQRKALYEQLEVFR